MTAATAITTEAPPGVEARERRSRWQWRAAAGAAAVLAVLAGFVVVQARDGRVPWLSSRGIEGELEGRTFRASTISVDGGPAEPARGTLSFGDERLSAQSCNSVEGPYTVDGDQLNVGPGLMSTAMNCGDVSLADSWEVLLSSSPSVALIGERLTLTAGTTVLELVSGATPIPDPTTTTTVDAADLAGRTFWGTTISEGGADRLLVGPPDEPPHLSVRFGSDRVVVTAGCNTGDSAYRIVDGRLVGGSIRADMACRAPTSGGASALDEQDAWLNAFLASEPVVSLVGERLRLSSATSAIELTDRETWTPAAGLADVSWQLVATRVGADEVTIPDVAWPGRPQVLLAAEDGPRPDAWGIRFADGCVSGGVRVLVNPSELVLAPLESTTVLCTGSDAELARQVDAVLQGRATYALEGTTLTITNGGRALVFTPG